MYHHATSIQAATVVQTVWICIASSSHAHARNILPSHLKKVLTRIPSRMTYAYRKKHTKFLDTIAAHNSIITFTFTSCAPVSRSRPSQSDIMLRRTARSDKPEKFCPGRPLRLNEHTHLSQFSHHLTRRPSTKTTQNSLHTLQTTGRRNGNIPFRLKCSL